MSIRPLFLIGTKRAGSTLSVNLLNLHPRVFVTHESDVAWILYQAVHGWPNGRRCHPLDAARGFESTLASCGELVDAFERGPRDRAAIREAFNTIQRWIMKHGSAMDKPRSKPDLLWLGDKKPVQHADPEVGAFLRANFPEARYLHVVRHPRATVASMVRAARSWRVVPESWSGSPADVLAHWTEQEERVLDAKRAGEIEIHSLRLEDLCAEPVRRMAEVYAFLDLEMPESLADRIRHFVDPDPNRKYDGFELDVSPPARAVMDRYRYR